MLKKMEDERFTQSDSNREVWELAQIRSSTRVIASCMFFSTALLALYAMYTGRNLFIPIAVALFMYLTMRPIVRTLTKYGVPSPISAAGLMTLVLFICGGGAYLLSGPIRDVLAEIPNSLGEVKAKLAFVFDHVESVNAATEDISDSADEMEKRVEKPVPVEIKQPAWTRTSPLIAGTGNAVSFLSIAGVLLYFLLAAGDTLIANLVASLSKSSTKRRLIEVIENVQEALSSYLAWVTAINACLGLAIGLAMWTLGMPSPVLWAIAAMLLNYIPIVGAVLGIGASFFVALVAFDSLPYAGVVAACYATLTTIEGQFITPTVLGRSMELSSLMVFLFIVVWGWMWGFMGIFLAVPILIAVSMITEQFESLAPMHAVLSGRDLRVNR